MWHVTSAGKLMYNYSYPSTDYKWSIAHLKWWIGDLYLSSLFRHHQTHPSGNYSFPWQAETVIFHGDQNSHQPLLPSVPINDRRSVGKSQAGSHNLRRFLYKDFRTCLGWCIYMRFTSGSSFTWGEVDINSSVRSHTETKRVLFHDRQKMKKKEKWHDCENTV